MTPQPPQAPKISLMENNAKLMYIETGRYCPTKPATAIPRFHRAFVPLLHECGQFDSKYYRALTLGTYEIPLCTHPINLNLARFWLLTPIRKPHLLTVRQTQPPQEQHRSTREAPKHRDTLPKPEKPISKSNLDPGKEGDKDREMPSSCQDIRDALAQCLQESDCIMVQRHTAKECLRPPLLETMPTKCQQLKHGLGQCKRGMVDMRKRFRGNQPIAVSKELEGVSSDQTVGGGQLYGGKPAYGTVKATSGHEPEQKDWREVENEKYRKD